MNRHVVAVALVVLAFFAVRFVTADEDYVSETMGWMASQTGVELPDWYADHPWLAVGLEGDGLVFVTQTVDPFGFEGHSDRLLRPGYRFTRIGYPLAAKVITLGVDDLAPVGLFVLSTLGVGMSAWAALRMRDKWGPWAWLLVVNPATILGYLAGTSEPLGVGLAAVALASGSRCAPVAMATVRPSLLPVFVGRWRLLMVGGAAAVSVRVVGAQLFGTVGGGHIFTVPYAAYVSHGSVEAWVLATVATVTVVVGVWRRDLAWIASGMVVLMFSGSVLGTPVNAWRTSGMLWLVIASQRRHVPEDDDSRTAGTAEVAAASAGSAAAASVG